MWYVLWLVSVIYVVNHIPFHPNTWLACLILCLTTLSPELAANVFVFLSDTFDDIATYFPKVSKAYHTIDEAKFVRDADVATRNDYLCRCAIILVVMAVMIGTRFGHIVRKKVSNLRICAAGTIKHAVWRTIEVIITKISSVAIRLANKIVYICGFGYAQAERNTPNLGNQNDEEISNSRTGYTTESTCYCKTKAMHDERIQEELNIEGIAAQAVAETKEEHYLRIQETQNKGAADKLVEGVRAECNSTVADLIDRLSKSQKRIDDLEHVGRNAQDALCRQWNEINELQERLAANDESFKVLEAGMSEDSHVQQVNSLQGIVTAIKKQLESREAEVAHTKEKHEAAEKMVIELENALAVERQGRNMVETANQGLASALTRARPEIQNWKAANTYASDLRHQIDYNQSTHGTAQPSMTQVKDEYLRSLQGLKKDFEREREQLQSHINGSTDHICRLTDEVLELRRVVEVAKAQSFEHETTMAQVRQQWSAERDHAVETAVNSAREDAQCAYNIELERLRQTAHGAQEGAIIVATEELKRRLTDECQLRVDRERHAMRKELECVAQQKEELEKKLSIERANVSMMCHKVKKTGASPNHVPEDQEGAGWSNFDEEYEDLKFELYENTVPKKGAEEGVYRIWQELNERQAELFNTKMKSKKLADQKTKGLEASLETLEIRLDSAHDDLLWMKNGYEEQKKYADDRLGQLKKLHGGITMLQPKMRLRGGDIQMQQ